MVQLVDLLQREMQVGRDNYGRFHNGHEAYGVAKEELEEFFDEVRANTGDQASACYEMLQLSAVALRYCREYMPDIDTIKQIQDTRHPCREAAASLFGN